MARNKIYVGSCVIGSDDREVFRSKVEPTIITHPNYVWAIGPFRTVRAAKWCVAHPHADCMTVSEFERAALLHAGQSELCESYMKHLTK
jgi:hypothetical protein